MKKLFLMALAVMAVCTVGAKQYCGSTIVGVNNGHKAYISCQSLGGDQYELRFVSKDPMLGYNAGSNVYANVDGVGGYHVSEHFVQTVDTLVCVITSNAVPTLYVGDFFVNYADGEEMYKLPTDADFSQTCTSVVPDGGESGEGTPGGDAGEGGDTPGDDSGESGLTPGACGGTSKDVDEFYSSQNNKAVTVLNQGYTWSAQTLTDGVKLTMQFHDDMAGMAAPMLFLFDMEGVLDGNPKVMQWEAGSRTASYMLNDKKDGDHVVFLVQVALENGGILFSSRFMYTVGSDCSSAEEGGNEEGGEESALQDEKAEQNVQKIVESGHLVIIRNGVRYSMLGQRIR